MAKLLLDSNAHPYNKYQVQDKQTPAIYAASHGNTEIIHTLIKKQLLNEKELNECLWYSAAKGYKEIVEMLLNANANINYLKKNKTPIILAARYGHLDVVTLVVERGATIWHPQLDIAWGALEEAAQYDQQEIAAFLVKQGVDITKEARGVATPNIASLFNLPPISSSRPDLDPQKIKEEEQAQKKMRDYDRYHKKGKKQATQKIPAQQPRFFKVPMEQGENSQLSMQKQLDNYKEKHRKQNKNSAWWDFWKMLLTTLCFCCNKTDVEEESRHLNYHRK